MQYANTIKEVPNACNEGPLNNEELRDFFVQTMETRTGDEFYSPFNEIEDACCTPSEHNAFLLLGHRGCGKSTELNNLAAHLRTQGTPVRSIFCNEAVNMATVEFSDILILLGDALLEIANSVGAEIGENVENAIQDFWITSVEQTYETKNETEGEMSGGGSGKLALPSIFDIFISMRGSVKYSDTTLNAYRKTMRQKPEEWINWIQAVIISITEKTGKQPVLIFEDLDKLDEASAWRVFSQNSKYLTAPHCPLIYTFPIALSYSSQFATLESYFGEPLVLPMVKIENINGSRNENGYQKIRDILAKRMDTSLFEDGIMDYMIEMTGGALRDLLSAVAAAGRRAGRRGGDKISRKDADVALTRMESLLTRRIDDTHYRFLVNICKGNRQQITDKKMLLEMLIAGAVLEYNGQRWNNVHPLIKRFLDEQGLMSGGTEN